MVECSVATESVVDSSNVLVTSILIALFPFLDALLLTFFHHFYETMIFNS